MGNTKWKLPIIIGTGVIAVALMVVLGIQSSQNRAIALEEQVNTASSDIKVQEKPFCIVVGSNPEPESRSDYAWDNNIDNLKCVSFNGCLVEDDAICFSASFVNLTNEDITVNEVGMIAKVYASTAAAKPVLLAREVYKEPIIVKANGGAQTFGLRLR